MVTRRRLYEPLLYWAHERENIRLAKVAGKPSPWTDDSILHRYRFCNVRRRDDRVSQWLINNVLNSYDSFNDKDVFVQFVALCRWVNWPPTILKLQQGGLIHEYMDWKQIGDAIDELVKSGTKAWTGAYMVRAPSKRIYPGVTKGQFIALHVVGAIWSNPTVMAEFNRAIVIRSAEGAWSALCQLPNWGSFMAGQVVADLMYTPVLQDSVDKYRWAPLGPGSKRGFNRLKGRPLKQRIDDEEWREQLIEWRGMLVDEVGLPDLTLHDVQNCLCEVDKYLRVKNGEGRPRATYNPETAY